MEALEITVKVISNAEILTWSLATAFVL